MSACAQSRTGEASAIHEAIEIKCFFEGEATLLVGDETVHAVAGDVVVMLTDGVQEGYPGGEEALREAIGKLHWLHPQAVGEKLIAQVMASGEARDDMAVLCARVGRQLMA